ncbi:probable xyloglucan endotransglucosylase/hydrolase protein 23 [Panicum hallii]|uniref:probable xyloglucan endotransglucosylase/hydrolase protein 23 n=1 Tax=Panicum hallii TaxID=206008 RepID=UPI000DF4D833|nr:probable xyloglucan endotransglucosylase/hydrolase protein 23 [Panicum hallii]
MNRWSVGGVPVRVFRNHEPVGAPYLGGQAMRAHGSMWNGESWATQGGRVKTNWSAASYGGYAATACVVPAPDASSSPGDAEGAWMDRQPGPEGVAWARENYMIYDYCDDRWRFPQGPPAECNLDHLG